jgi:S-adenosylmethionine:tRNA ribosyltransferase-isomerase
MTNIKGSRTSDYEFHLPTELIAQQPLAERSASRLMIVHRADGRIEHRRFSDLVDVIPPKDLLIVNTSRVIKARLLGQRASGAPAEILLLHGVRDDVWEAMVSPGGKLKPGRKVEIGPELTIEILETTERRTRLVRIITPLTHADAIEKYGHIPLPPYIQRADSPDDAERYQTVYAVQRGSIAAPTAGLHFTQDLLDALRQRGVERAGVQLHVGAGTFKPVDADDPADHVMHEERYSIPVSTADAVASARARGANVWAVGTTSMRTLESAATETRGIRAEEGETRIFIRPPHEFRVVDRLITNFHLPRSTLLMLVAAFAGYDLTMRAYREAVEQRYRFFSYGDAMVVI